MKKYFLIILLCAVILVTGCSSSSEEEGGKGGADDSKYSVYELHYYDSDFKHTEEVEAKYDKDGNFKYLAIWLVWTERTSCEGWEDSIKEVVDLTYPGVKAECTVTDKGIKALWSMTDESVKAGYLDGDENWRFNLEQVYPYFKTEKDANDYVEKSIESFKNDGIKPDDQNYVVVKGERVSW